jgi:hypothetical protein
MDANELIVHSNQKSLEELCQFAGQWVAWSEDGRQILTSAADLDTLFQEIDRIGLRHYVLDRIPLPGEDFLGATA